MLSTNLENLIVVLFNPLGFLILIAFIFYLEYLLFRSILKDKNNPIILKAFVVNLKNGIFRYPRTIYQIKDVSEVLNKKDSIGSFVNNQRTEYGSKIANLQDFSKEISNKKAINNS